MNGMAELIESELSSAIMHQDKEAIKRISLIFGDNIKKSDIIDKENGDLKADVKSLSEVMKIGFENVDKRFEDMNKRFEDMNKRFEDMNKRFEDMNKRFGMMFRFMSIGFSIVSLLIVVFKFLK